MLPGRAEERGAGGGRGGGALGEAPPAPWDSGIVLTVVVTDDQDLDTGAVSVFFDPTGTLIVLVGDVDRVLSEDLEHAGRDAIDHGQPITIDAHGVTFMDSVGVAFLVRLAASIPAKEQVVLRDPSLSVLDLLQITGSIPLFRVTSS